MSAPSQHQHQHVGYSGAALHHRRSHDQGASPRSSGGRARQFRTGAVPPGLASTACSAVISPRSPNVGHASAKCSTGAPHGVTQGPLGDPTACAVQAKPGRFGPARLHDHLLAPPRHGGTTAVLQLSRATERGTVTDPRTRHSLHRWVVTALIGCAGTSPHPRLPRTLGRRHVPSPPLRSAVGCDQVTLAHVLGEPLRQLLDDLAVRRNVRWHLRAGQAGAGERQARASHHSRRQSGFVPAPAATSHRADRPHDLSHTRLLRAINSSVDSPRNHVGSLHDSVISAAPEVSQRAAPVALIYRRGTGRRWSKRRVSRDRSAAVLRPANDVERRPGEPGWVSGRRSTWNIRRRTYEDGGVVPSRTARS